MGSQFDEEDITALSSAASWDTQPVEAEGSDFNGVAIGLAAIAVAILLIVGLRFL